MKQKLFICLCVIFPIITEASHIIGLRITYEYINNSMLFKVKLYRDCMGISAPTSVVLCFESASNCSPSFYATLPMDAGNSGFQVPFNSCNGTGPTTCNGGSIFAFEEYNYKSVVAVNPCDDWVASVSFCCRNAAITNLVNPDFYSASVETHFDNLNYPTNSSPEFNAVPVNYYCAGIPSVVDYSAFDVDGDSLTYEFTPINDGSCGSFAPIPYQSLITYDQPLYTLVPTVFDPIGGQILFTPSMIQIGVIGFRVNEYRNGQLIGSVRRDDEIVVVGGFVDPDTIAGRVYYDVNTNNVFDTGDVPAGSVAVHLGPGNSYTMTSSIGKYDFQTGAGSFSAELPNPPPYVTYSPTTHTVITSGNGLFYGNRDFPLVLAPNMNDLSVELNSTVPPIPGNSYPLIVNYSNQGSTNQTNVAIDVTLDQLIQFVSAAPVPSTINGNVYTWNFASMNFLTMGTILIQTTVDTPAVSGNILTCSAAISSAVVDVAPANNSTILADEVRASFDPNSKEVSPEGDLPIAFVNSQQWINYRINFQNLGTAPAQIIHITDLLDFDLDQASVDFVGSSFPCTMSLSNPNQLKFEFFGINLPAASVNEPASHGFVKFRVKPKPNLAPGTYITNNAHIIFDFNSPIYTNLVANRVVVSTGIKEITERNPSFIMMPNPADERTTIELESDAAYNTTLTIYDVVGARVITDQFFINAGYNSLELDTGSLKAGIYLVQLNYGNRTESRTLSIY